MPRPRTKEELINAATAGFDNLNELINGLSDKELNTPFNFFEDERKKKPIGGEIKI